MKPHSINIFLLEGDPNGRRARPPQRAYSLNLEPSLLSTQPIR